MAIADKSIDSRLLNSARKEFLKCGFLNAELKTICDNAGITTGAVYRRYKGKENLFCATVKDAVYYLDDFIKARTDVDFTRMTDEQINASWIMNEAYVLAMFENLWKIHDTFVLLISKAAGTRYENFQHDFVQAMSYAYEQFYSEARKRGLARARITREELHTLCSAFWSSIYEPFIHNMTWDQIRAHCKVICRFFDWAAAIELVERKG